ncbi:hypothetical protein ALP73_200186 [Pseudomonas coronafaciens pv. garcae]|uniref:Uncharacterized protein n=1 Tax=Pseudomonas coronafaciens pv. garcae TaxID=251653 RepID=A0AB37QML0_9PSED|nr:hypothetical protein ALP74_200219 [Pseudomonas coronafaciens pv. garcae]RMS06813.1 hypothetical protein ALP73_200186 [Pseudomonas coronafaciens pv. garcae]
MIALVNSLGIHEDIYKAILSDIPQEFNRNSKRIHKCFLSEFIKEFNYEFMHIGV